MFFSQRSVNPLLLISTIFVIFALFGCDSGGPELRTTEDCGPTCQLRLALDDGCTEDSTAGEFSGVVLNVDTTAKTQYKVHANRVGGAVIDSGEVRNLRDSLINDDKKVVVGDIPETTLPKAGEFPVSVKDFEKSDGGGGTQVRSQAQDDVVVDCTQENIGPGIVDSDSDCNENNNGIITISAGRGFEEAEVVFDPTGEVVLDTTGLTPVEDQTLTVSGLEEDGRYTSTVTKDSIDGTTDDLVGCSTPGPLSKNVNCSGGGTADLTLTAADGLQSYELFVNDSLFASGSEIEPKENQTLPLDGDAYSDVPNGSWQWNPTLYGNEGELTFNLSCQGEGPDARFSYSVNGREVSFDGSESSDDGTIEEYQWDFGDGTTGSGETTTHTYDQADETQVTLTVTDDDGLSDGETKTVEPLAPPVAQFTVAVSGDTANVNAEGSFDPDESVEEYQWEFGDGTTATGVTASHVYDEPGTYTIALTVTDTDDLTGTTTNPAVIEELVACQCTYEFGGDKFVDDVPKFWYQDLLVGVELVPTEPKTDSVQVAIDQRYGPDENEASGWGIHVNQTDTTLADYKNDTWDGPETWTFRTWSVHKSFFPVDQDVTLFGDHAGARGGPGTGGGNSVWYHDSMASSPKLDDQAPKGWVSHIMAEDNISAGTVGYGPKDHTERGGVVKVTYFERGDCPPRYSPVNLSKLKMGWKP